MGVGRRGLLGLLLCGGTARAATAEAAQVTIDNFTFTPAVLTVPRGTQVMWVNRDDIPHTVADAAEVRLFKSPAMDTDETFGFMFAAPGTVRYFCSLHPHMQGTIVVT